MSDGATNPAATEGVEPRLRAALEQGDRLLDGIAPVLRHLLANDDSGLFGDLVVARVRGMTRDVAQQLLAPLAPVAGGEAALSALGRALVDSPAFLTHLHALVLEWQLAELLQTRLALDPVLSPLLQALIGSADENTAALAMKVLAAQARFGQAQRRMRLPLSELPGDLLHGALLAMRTLSGDDAAADAAAARAEAAIRADYDEGRSRLGMLARLVTGMGAGAIAALSLPHAGAAIFLSALAVASAQDRDVTVLATSETQRTRLALALCAAGLSPSAIDEQLLALDPDGPVPAGIDRLDRERAAALLAAQR
jgi:hypothetical protein